MLNALLLNIGNTNSQVAQNRSGAPDRVVQFATSEWLGSGQRLVLLDENFAKGCQCLAACVVPEVKDALIDRYGPKHISWLEPGMITEIDFSPVDARTIGGDRLANARAALSMVPPPVVVLDCGTAITTEVLDPQRRFRGGAILPGRRLMRKALHQNTGLLPDVPMQSGAARAIGADTHRAILAGVDGGILGAVQRLLDKTLEELGIDRCTIIATGGDAPFFLHALDGLTAAPPDFTLRGLAAVAEKLFARQGTGQV